MQHPRLPHLALRRPHARRPLPRRPRPLQSPRRAAAGPRRRRAGVLAARPRPPPRHRLAALPPRRRRRGRDGAGEAGLGEVAQDLRRVGPHRAGGAAHSVRDERYGTREGYSRARQTLRSAWTRLLLRTCR